MGSFANLTCCGVGGMTWSDAPLIGSAFPSRRGGDPPYFGRSVVQRTGPTALYIKGNNKLYKSITTTYKDYNIMSALLLREFVHSL